MFLETPLQLEDEFWLWPENEAMFCLWLAVQSQWNVADGRKYKLDYQGVKVVMEAREMWGGDQLALIQMMESACLREWGRRK